MFECLLQNIPVWYCFISKHESIRNFFFNFIIHFDIKTLGQGYHTMSCNIVACVRAIKSKRRKSSGSSSHFKMSSSAHRQKFPNPIGDDEVLK